MSRTGKHRGVDIEQDAVVRKALIG
jgi:hypothetical protein